MRTLLFLLFLACLVPLLLFVDVVRWVVSKHRLALLSVRQAPSEGRTWRIEESFQRQSQKRTMPAE